MEIDTEVKERTALKARANHSDEDRKAWLEKCSAVKKLITDSKRQPWRDFATKLNARSDPSKVWNTIRAIGGRGKRAPEGAAMELKNTSPGDDQIHNKLLTHLPPSGKMALLTLFNRVYKSGQYPAAWRKGTIIPILKAGKDPAFMSSQRPIQLTSSLGKLFEKLVKVRMNYWLESENLLNPKPAGFRSLKSTEDQVTRITKNHRRWAQ
ncbi:RNA-directed DNA polymerase from mobile element jockey [Elysia marginata]|uniref:RNA-directed DNA polymerase from mobile element jockey n=1 Tax=Elysia marginata TaxID=1093978 RepID=A0AAV4GJV2_9GAST|nr:RNA-directed DNA polymerase from mobile element jockey [Elysia marginata]